MSIFLLLGSPRPICCEGGRATRPITSANSVKKKRGGGGRTWLKSRGASRGLARLECRITECVGGRGSHWVRKCRVSIRVRMRFRGLPGMQGRQAEAPPRPPCVAITAKEQSFKREKRIAATHLIRAARFEEGDGGREGRLRRKVHNKRPCARLFVAFDALGHTSKLLGGRTYGRGRTDGHSHRVGRRWRSWDGRRERGDAYVPS